MNEKQFGFRIKQTLNLGLNLDEPTLERLKAARLAALLKHQATSPELVFATANNAGRIYGDAYSVAIRIVLPLIFLILGLYASNHWYFYLLRRHSRRRQSRNHLIGRNSPPNSRWFSPHYPIAGIITRPGAEERCWI